MAIRRVLGLDHIPPGTAYGAIGSGHGLALLDLGIVYTPPGGGFGYCQGVEVTISGETRNTMSFYRSSNANSHKTNIRFPLSKAGITGAYDFYFGTRISAGQSNGMPMLSLMTAGGTGGSGQVLFSNSVIESLNNLDPGHFLEFKIDATTGVVTRRIDGTDIDPVTLSAALLNSFKAGTSWIGIGTQSPIGQPAGYDYWTRLWDTYFIEDTKDDSHNGFLGPVTLKPLRVTEVEGSTWSAVGADNIPAAYAAPFTNVASLTTPVARSTTNNNAPLKNKLSVDVPEGRKIFAVDIVSYVSKQAAGDSAVITTTLKSGETTASSNNVALSTSATLHKVTPAPLEKNLNGQEWNHISVNQLSVDVSSVGS